MPPAGAISPTAVTATTATFRRGKDQHQPIG